ncbi:hypothetical protein [Pseudomonas juntendi]|uniref:Uncharacterized protein n=1 Tax=Pseudomonas juntendi TaxID=2666183 RepID=A0A7W2LY68_9PSED|nr:hypothetical protein [Pseudomonas juntendi]MBA6133874.1 hypothetical protein [Pseudomonas juntendi]MBA6149198.1 hypothetical protein [Pseudomonas juntendi]
MDLMNFNDVVDNALLAFYESFPTPINIDPKTVGLSQEEPNRSDIRRPSYSAEWHKLADDVNHAITWLHNEGYLHGTESNMRFTLSAKGLILLQQMKGVVIPRMLRD